MPRGKITLYDVPPEQRAKGAAEARKATLQMLSNPLLSNEQREELRERLKWASKFENCDIVGVLAAPEASPPESETPREPVNHDIEITESLSVNEV